MTALQVQVPENWADDFEFQAGKRTTSTAVTANLSQAIENWDEGSLHSSEKVTQGHHEGVWDNEVNQVDDENEDGEFGSFAEEFDHTLTAKSRWMPLAELPTSGHLHPPRSPTSSAFSLPITVHTYSSTAHLRPTTAFAFLPPSPSPPIHKERERRRLKKRTRPKSQAVFELVEVPPQERPSFSDLGLPQPASELGSRIASGSDLSIHGNLVGNNNSTFYSCTPNASRLDLNEDEESSVGSKRTAGKGKETSAASDTGNPKLPTRTPTPITAPMKLVKRKTFGFVLLGRGFGGHWGGENEPVGGSEGRSGMLEKDKENGYLKGKGKEGARSFMHSVRRISLVVSVRGIGRHKKAKGGSGSGSHACITAAPSSTTTNADSGKRYTSSHTSAADLGRAASLSSQAGGGGSGDPIATFVSASHQI